MRISNKRLIPWYHLKLLDATSDQCTFWKEMLVLHDLAVATATAASTMLDIGELTMNAGRHAA